MNPPVNNPLPLQSLCRFEAFRAPQILEQADTHIQRIASCSPDIFGYLYQDMYSHCITRTQPIPALAKALSK